MDEPGPRRHRITVDEYYRMAEVGLLAHDARVELIEGEIIDMAPIGLEHGWVVEVSDSTVRYDLKVKTPLYARHGVPEVWILDLPKHRLHVFGSLVGGAYTATRIDRAPGKTAIAALPGLFIDLSQILLAP